MAKELFHRLLIGNELIMKNTLLKLIFSAGQLILSWKALYIYIYKSKYSNKI